MLKKVFNYVRAGFSGLKPPHDEIGDRIRAAMDREADLEKRGMVHRPPNAEGRPRGSDFVNRRGQYRREREIQDMLMVGHRPRFRDTK